MVTAFIFPGQGSQTVGMGSIIQEEYSVARDVFQEADSALGYSLSSIIKNGPIEKLTETEITQPAILTCSIAYLRILQEWGVEASFSAGHSLGEYCALVSSGALDFSTAVKTVRLRGRYMQNAVPIGVGTMTAVMMLDAQTVERLCKESSTDSETVEPAGYNSPQQLACAGHVEAISRLELAVDKAGGTSKRLNVSAPFHSSLLKKASSDLATDLETISFSNLKFPYVANVDAEVVIEPSEIKWRLIEQVMKPVRWEQSIKKMLSLGVDRFIEVGPGKTLSGLMRKIDRKIPVISVDDPKSLLSLKP